MSKTKTAKKTAPKIPEAPLSLRLLFSMLRESDWTPIAPSRHATKSLPAARRVLKQLHSGSSSACVTVETVLAAVPEIFGGNLIEPEYATEPSHVATAGFQIGVATAWLVMQGVNGREVTR